MPDDKSNVIAQLSAVKRAVAVKLAARLVRGGGCDDSQHRTQKH
jgi:hypothetical protein